MTPAGRPPEVCPTCHEPIDFGATEDVIAAPYRGLVAYFHVLCLDDRRPEPVRVSARLAEILETVDPAA